MAQNTSHAVMQQRSEPHDSLDDFPTPPWATRALCEHVIKGGQFSVMEPCCNRGYMAKPLKEYFDDVYCSDIHDYEWEGQDAIQDFLFTDMRFDWIITNPPFRLAEQVINHAIDHSNIGVAVIVRSAFLEGVGRYKNLFSKNPPSIIAQFAERVPMVKGRYDAKASTATSYTWLVWLKDETETKFVWIPPCRKQLEFEDDQ